MSETRTGHWSDGLWDAGACREAVEWCRDRGTLAEAWGACERGDWMLWLLGRTNGSSPWSEGRRPLALCAADCAELSLPHVSGDARRVAEECLATLRAWCRGEATGEQVAAARHAAYAASYAADASYAAAYAAYAADAAYAAAYAAVYAAGSRALRECAVVVRRHFPSPPVLP